VFYFSKQRFAAHTNNVVDYVVSHDEDSVPAGLQNTPLRDNVAPTIGKGQLGVLLALLALGQPMLFTGHEFNSEQPRNIVTVGWPQEAAADPFFSWATGIVAMRRSVAISAHSLNNCPRSMVRI
jgi:hypothetical protein